MILGAEEADLLTQVNDDKPKSAERSPFWRVRIILLTLCIAAGKPCGVVSEALENVGTYCKVSAHEWLAFPNPLSYNK
jgi:hypothetical protein